MWQMIAAFDPVQNQLQPVMWHDHGCVGECRPRLVVFVNCTDVVVRDVTLRDSADWTQLYRLVNNVTLENLNVLGSQQWPNGDGVDFESCATVLVRNCTFFTGDDGIVLASGNCNNMSAPWPEPPGAYSPTRDVLIEDTVISSYSSGIKHEQIFQLNHGDVFNVLVRDTVIHDSARGIGFQQRTATGAAYNFTFERVSVLRTKGITGHTWWGRGEALWITSLHENGARPPSNSTLGGLRDITFRDCVLEGEQGAHVFSRGQGDAHAGAAGVSGLTFVNTSVRIGVYGNATWPGVHDLSPYDAGPYLLQVNVTGWWLEHADDVTIDGGSVSFIGAAQSFWTPNASCINATTDSSVHVVGDFTCNLPQSHEDV
jgi:hypothetical protein